jgi:hypothetical protein
MLARESIPSSAKDLLSEYEYGDISSTTAPSTGMMPTVTSHRRNLTSKLFEYKLASVASYLRQVGSKSSRSMVDIPFALRAARPGSRR